MSVTAAQGFVAAGRAAGLKESGKPDLAVVRNLGPDQHAAVVLTRNRVQAAPVQWTREVCDGSLSAVVVNSGGANACTGAPGYDDAVRMAELTARAFEVPREEVAVCSTGLIGVRLPMDLLEEAIPQVCADADASSGAQAAEAILTTDTVSKQAVHHGEGWTLGGMAKGAGMLAPGLATMLVVITTDAVTTPEDLQHALTVATDVTLNRLDSDGCMSTNDTVLLMSSGASGRPVGRAELTAALTGVCHDLGQQLLGDAEGAQHDIEVEVVNAASETDAVEVARAVTSSNLFKCAVFGCDPNWGRVLSAVGTTRAAFDPQQLDVAFNGVEVCRAGGIGEDRELVDLSDRTVHVRIDLHAGEASASVWTNDLTYDYVKENAEYAT